MSYLDKKVHAGGVYASYLQKFLCRSILWAEGDIDNKVIGEDRNMERLSENEIKRTLFVYNPKAGKGTVVKNLHEIVDAFTKVNYPVTVYPTQTQGDACRLVETRDAGQYDLIVCSGGDGTLREVVNGLMKSGVATPVGYIPAGSTNDFARSLGLPDDIPEAMEIITKGKPFLCDAGNFNGENFVYVAAFGLFTDVSYATNQQWKNIFGHVAYILEGVKSLSSIQSYEVQIECDEGTMRGNYIYGMVTNSLSVGGFKNITGKDVSFDDGKFEVILIRRPATFAELNDIVISLLRQSFDAICMQSFKTSYLKIKSREEINWTLDGEFGGTYIDVEIKNVQRAFPIMVRK